MNRYYFILVIFCSLLFSGCTKRPTAKIYQPTENAIAAKYLHRQGQHKKAAALYQTIAKNTPSQQNQYNLLAAESLIQSGDSHAALIQIALIDSNTLTLEQRNRLYVLYAQIHLSNGEAELALSQLNQAKTYNLALAQQVTFYQSLAFAHSLTDNPLKSAKARIALSPLLSDTQQQYKNNRAILASLNTLPSEFFTEHVETTDTLAGWLALSQALKTNNNSEEGLLKWQRTYPQHPANFGFLQDYFGKPSINLTANININQPNSVAILLPESGRFASAARVIKKGFLAAYQQVDGRLQPSIRFYDTAASDSISVYQQAISEGAELVIGPLSKENIQTLASGPELSIPVLALNHIPSLSKNNLLQFGLSPLDDTQQITEKASRDGHHKAVFLAPKTRQGRRIATFLTKSWQAMGNTVLETQYYNARSNNFSRPIRNLLNLNESNRRYKRIKRFLNKNIQFTEKKRQDTEAIFLVASPSTGRSVYPQLRFHRSGNIPVYSTAKIYTGHTNSSRDIDLNTIIFCDIPWIFSQSYSGALSKSALRDLWKSTPNKYLRLVALGIDSFNIINHIGSLAASPYVGATGVLSINNENRITRQLTCAKFVNGRAALFNPPKIIKPIDENSLLSDEAI